MAAPLESKVIFLYSFLVLVEYSNMSAVLKSVPNNNQKSKIFSVFAFVFSLSFMNSVN